MNNFRDGNSIDYYEEFPVNLLHEFPQRTGRSQASRVLVVTLEYGPNYSGPGQDTFRPCRVHADAWMAYKCNFLHPVFYYYDTLPSREFRSESGN